MELAILILLVTFCNLGCFIIGTNVGQKVNKGEDVELPSISPLKAVREHRERKVAEKEQSKIETIIQNIEKYDGTARGQEDVG